MTKAMIVSGRVNPDLASRIDRLAARIDRPRGWIVAQALERYVTAELDLIDSLDEAEAQIDRGEFYTQAQMEAWFEDRHRRQAAE